MKVFKAALTGLAVVFVVALLTGMPLLLSKLKYPAKDGYFVIVHWHVWPLLLLSALGFSTGFFWQNRRAR